MLWAVAVCVQPANHLEVKKRGGGQEKHTSCPSVKAMSLAFFRKWICQLYHFKDSSVVTTAMAAFDVYIRMMISEYGACK